MNGRREVLREVTTRFSALLYHYYGLASGCLLAVDVSSYCPFLEVAEYNDVVSTREIRLGHGLRGANSMSKSATSFGGERWECRCHLDRHLFTILSKQSLLGTKSKYSSFKASCLPSKKQLTGPASRRSSSFATLILKILCIG